MERRYPWLPEHLRNRYSRAYGTRIDHVIGKATSFEGLGAQVVRNLHEREIEYLEREEWALGAEDILWRRSKLGLHLPATATDTLNEWLNARARRLPQEA